MRQQPHLMPTRSPQKWLPSLTRLLAAVLIVGFSVPLSMSAPTYATATNPTLNFYISPPAVMNTLVKDAKVATFDNKTPGDCPKEWETDDGILIGTISGTGCKIVEANKYGGAVPPVPDADGTLPDIDDKPYKPTSTDINNPDAGTNFVSIPANKQTTLTLAQPESYLGFWWSAGDRNNKITLYSGGTNGTRVGIFQTSSLTKLLAGPTVNTITGDTFRSCLYYGNPRYVDRTEKCAADAGGVPNFPNEPFSYIHLVGEGGLTFDTIVFSQVGGAGFELDNVAIQRGFVVDPATDNIALFPPELNATTPNLTGTTCDSFPSSFGLIASNFAQTPTYSISPTTLPSGLTFNQATGTISGTATSTFSRTTYTVTATAQTTGTTPVTQTASTAVSLEVIACPTPPPPPKPPTPVEWEPETTTFEITEFPAIITPDPPPPPPGGGTYTFTGDPESTSNCEVDKFTSTMSVPQPGTCVVTANVGETRKLGKASITVTFTITGPALAATGAPAWPLWAAITIVAGAATIATSTLIRRRHS